MSDQVKGQQDDGTPEGVPGIPGGHGDDGPARPVAAPAEWQPPGAPTQATHGRPAQSWPSPPPPQNQGSRPGGWGTPYPPQNQGGRPGGWGTPHPPQNQGGRPAGWGPGPAAGPYGGRPFPPGPLYQAPPKPGVIPLRPLGLGEILDGAFQACRKNPLATFGIAILLQAVVALVTVLLLGNVLSSFEALEAENPTPDSIIAAVAGFGVVATVSGVVSAAALLVLQGILVVPIARAVIDQRTSFGQAWRLARGRILPLLGFGLLSFAAGLVGLVLVVGISALAVLGLEEYSALVIVPLVLGAVALLVWVSIKIVVAPAALMLEGTGPWTSVKRSWALTRGTWWRTFGIVLLTSIIVSIIASVISAPLTFAVSLIVGFGSTASATPDVLDSLPVLLATQAITALFSAIGYAFQAGVTSLLYVDLRIRREGFDVVLMREHEQAGPGPSDVVPGGTSFGHQPGAPA
ncbi:proline-rich domain-containing protein [Arthrobacter sp. MDT1-65]